MTQGIEDGDRENLASRSDEFGDVKPSKLKSGLDAANDLTALLSRASLHESQYREFSPPARASRQIQGENPIELGAAHTAESEPVGTSRLEPQGVPHLHLTSREDAPTLGGEVFDASTPGANPFNGDRNIGKPASQPESARNGRKKSDSAFESRWSVLGRALSGGSDDSPGQLIQALSGSVSPPFTFIAPIRGGTGVTTILATLARCFAARGERVLLADSSAESLLPLYFGAANSGTGELQSFSIAGSHGNVDTVNRSEPHKHRASPATRPHGETEKPNLVSKIRNAAARSHRLLLDPGALHTSDAEMLYSTKQFGLVPLVPDLSCVFGLLKLEETLQPRETRGRPSTSSVFYILNKFDSSLALHRDVKASLERLLGDRLLPMTLRRSDAVAEALADGMTVMDYGPATGIAEDFVRLADWLLESAPTSFRARGE